MTPTPHPWLPRAGVLLVVGLWLWLPLNIRSPAVQSVPVIGEPARGELWVPVAGDPVPDVGELWVPTKRIADAGPGFWEKLEGMETVEIRNDRDSLLFQGTPDNLKRLLEANPRFFGNPPDEEPLLPDSTGVSRAGGEGGS